jgi:two-component system sensor histidine kinase RstB
MGRLYPVVDLVVLITVVTVTVRRTAYHFEPRLVILSAGLTIQAIVDLIYLDATRPGAIFAGEPDRLIVGLTLVAVTAYATTAVLPDRKVETQIRRTSPPILITAFPYVMVTALILILGIEAGTDISIVREARSLEYSLGVTLVVLLLLIRQAVSIRENRSSLEIQRRELVASISHEVRTPVTAILASLELLDTHGSELPDEELSELSGIALEQTRYMARMIEDLILLSRNRPSGLKLRARRISIDTAIDQAIADLDAPHVERRGVPGAIANADPDRLRQAIGNYLSNALQYGDSRCIVSVQRNGDVLMIDVHDDGPGVPYRFREIIWEHFERGSHRLDSQIQGSGIGLAVVDLIANAHGGYVEYRRSELLGGACFTIVLPLSAE